MSSAPGFWRRRLGRFHVTGPFWYRLHATGMRWLPRWAIAPAVAIFTTLFFLLLPRTRRAIEGNLEAVLGRCGWVERQRRVYRMLTNFAWSLTERYERLAAARGPELEIDGREHWEGLLAGERGFVIATAHVGNWETSLLDPKASPGRHLHVVREEERDPEAQRLVAELVEEQAGDAVTVHFARDDDVGLATGLVAALRRGELVALQGDRPRTGARSVRAPFFGRHLELPAGPLAIARAAEAPILPLFSFRRGRLRTEIACRPPIEVARSGDREADFAAAAGRLAADLEWAIGRHPYQWYCFRELWPQTAASPAESAPTQ